MFLKHKLKKNRNLIQRLPKLYIICIQCLIKNKTQWQLPQGQHILGAYELFVISGINRRVQTDPSEKQHLDSIILSFTNVQQRKYCFVAKFLKLSFKLLCFLRSPKFKSCVAVGLCVLLSLCVSITELAKKNPAPLPPPSFFRTGPT